MEFSHLENVYGPLLVAILNLSLSRVHFFIEMYFNYYFMYLIGPFNHMEIKMVENNVYEINCRNEIVGK